MVASSLAVAAEFDAATATNQFGLELFRREAAKRTGTNLVLSPYSIESAMTLVYPGADGVTKAELAKALHFPANEREVQASFARLRSQLEQMTQRVDKISAEASNYERVTATIDGAPVELKGEPVRAMEWQVANRLFCAARVSISRIVSEGDE